MTDSKYFTTTKKGEIFELKAELNSDKKEKKKEAVKKVIASMTVGKDVSALFPDVVNCMQTDNLELKKLVYLYLMNYAKSQPDMAIMAVNTFVKDCEDPNPLIRALAVRTMGCIRVDKITEYLCEPLRKCLKDEDPYVRKTAAVCVAKLHDINAQLVEDQGFLDTLKDLISDSNPMVVANAVAALSEIAESHPSSNLLDLNPQSINKLLTALNECTEWGQIFILDCLANYMPKDDREAQRAMLSAVWCRAVSSLLAVNEELHNGCQQLQLDLQGTRQGGGCTTKGGLVGLRTALPVLGLLLRNSDVELGMVLSDSPRGPLMSLPLMHVSDLCQIGDTNFGAPPAAVTAATGAAAAARLGAPVSSGLSDLFDLTSGVGTLSGSYVAPKAVWLPAMKAKGLEISGTFTRQVGSISMALQLTNKALQVMTDFAIQFNRNSFGLAPAAPLQVHAPLSPNQTVELSLPLSTVGSVMKMEPLNNLQVAVKNNIDVFYFSTLYPLHVLFVEDGKMDRQMFLATWKDIPNENEAQFQIRDCPLNTEAASNKLQSSNIFTVAKRNVEGQDMLYQSLKLTNGIWVLAELRIQPGNPSFTDLELSLKCRAPEVSQHVYQAYETILKN
ncbi:AP-1 complex subunit beta-1-like [Onychomys torridus]|uniref:AP-1 complex subunit beta-1-like n=1 Tax=Onychomys torridus TaxID=38674 RepID=UPI00167FD7A0|nr:AP-1 complex subunit beta-1-like [Onychomys torridus]